MVSLQQLRSPQVRAQGQMTGFNFFSHGSQDLYPKMIEAAKGKSSSVASKATIIGNVGAIDESFLNRLEFY